MKDDGGAAERWPLLPLRRFYTLKLQAGLFTRITGRSQASPRRTIDSLLQPGTLIPLCCSSLFFLESICPLGTIDLQARGDATCWREASWDPLKGVTVPARFLPHTSRPGTKPQESDAAAPNVFLAYPSPVGVASSCIRPVALLAVLCCFCVAAALGPL